MKLIFVFLVLLVAAASAGGGGKMMKIIKECAEQSKIKLGDVITAMKGSDPISEQMGCVGACVGIKLDILKPDGSANMETIKALSGKMKKFGDLFMKCSSSITGANKCQNGKGLMECIRSSIPKNNDSDD